MAHCSLYAPRECGLNEAGETNIADFRKTEIEMTKTTPRRDNATTNPQPIMIVGSSEETRYMLRVILEIWGYEVLEAGNQEESIRLGAETNPSLILLDTSRNFTDGLENIRILKRQDEMVDIPAVVLSGYAQDTYREAAINSGATAFLVKPIDFDELRHCVSTLAGPKPSTAGPGNSR